MALMSGSDQWVGGGGWVGGGWVVAAPVPEQILAPAVAPRHGPGTWITVITVLGILGY